MSSQGWKWRDGEISLKEFYSLSKEDREEYLILVKGLKKEDRSSTDEYFVNLYNLDKQIIKFLEL